LTHHDNGFIVKVYVVKYKLSRKQTSCCGRVHAHGGTVRKLNIMSEETVRVLKGIIKGLKLKKRGAKIAPL